MTVAKARLRVGHRQVALCARRIDRAEDRSHQKPRPGADGEIALPIVAVVQERDAAADGEAGEAAIERVAHDHGSGIAGRLHFDDVPERLRLQDGRGFRPLARASRRGRGCDQRGE